VNDVYNNLIGAVLIAIILIGIVKCEMVTHSDTEHRREIDAIYQFKLDSIKNIGLYHG
jgi:hypothetical protein